ncbi:hypothetical protein [Paraburkholderia phosphatilytica]|uniref:hypothetical protein n=1 Tax=Paraburkholderia phosphatilytica TaxID=2282883 RepID=UPI000F5D622D|nr:hypothetical protein [Paraburkholderia phosphatilytica]
MRPTQVAVLLAVCLGLSPLAHAGDDQDPDGSHRDRQHVLKVFDSQGKYVGPLVPIDQITIGAVVHANGTLIVAPISRISQNGQVSASQYQWASTLSAIASPPTVDCRGLPIINALIVPGVLRPSFSVRSGTVATAYIAGDVYSMPTPPNGQCTGQGSPTPSWLAQSTYPLTQNHPEPLSIHY